MEENLFCCICGELISSYLESHNPHPLGEYPDRCCTGCYEKVIMQSIKDSDINVDMP